MSGKINLKKENVESAFRLYIHLRNRRDSIQHAVLIACLIEAYGGLMFNEIVELTGLHTKIINSCLQLYSTRCVLSKDDVIPGRAWLSSDTVKGTRGTWKVTPFVRSLADKEYEGGEIPPRALKAFSTMLFNFKEHSRIMEKNTKITPKHNIPQLLSSALGAVANQIGITFNSEGRNDFLELRMMGYISKDGKNTLNKRAYLHDKIGVSIK